MAQIASRVNQGSAVQIYVKESLGNIVNPNSLSMGDGSVLLAAHWCGSGCVGEREARTALWGAMKAMRSAIKVESIYHLAGNNVSYCGKDTFGLQDMLSQLLSYCRINDMRQIISPA